MLEHVLELAITAGLHPILAVVPGWLRLPTHAHEPVTWVRNPHPERGMSVSLQLGFEALPAEAEAAVILLGDQPTLSTATIEAVLAGRGKRPITAASADGQPAPPVCVERSHFGIVSDATGDQGLRDFLLAHPDWVTAVEVGNHAPDVDTPLDLRRLEPTDDGA